MVVIVKMMGCENAPDSDTRKTYKLFTDVVTVEFERDHAENAFAVLRFREYHKVGEVCAAGVSEPERFELQGNVYVMNEDGKTISSFGPAPIPNTHTHTHIHGVADADSFKHSPKIKDTTYVYIKLSGKPKYILGGLHDGLQLRQLLDLPPTTPLSYWLFDSDKNVARWEEVHSDDKVCVTDGMRFVTGYGHTRELDSESTASVRKLANLAMAEKHSDPDRERRAFGEFDSESAPSACEKVVRPPDRERVPMKEPAQISLNDVSYSVIPGLHTGAWLRKKLNVDDAHLLYRARGKYSNPIEVMPNDSVTVLSGTEFFTSAKPGVSA